MALQVVRIPTLSCRKKKEQKTQHPSFCTGRDIEGRELFLEFNRSTFVWELISPIVIDARMIPEEIILLCNFIQSEKSFTGTASELAEKLKLDCNPSALKKKIIKHMDYLSKNGIHYSENRSRERREFSLCYDGNDTMTGNFSPLKFPSYVSHTSSDENLTATDSLSAEKGESSTSQ